MTDKKKKAKKPVILLTKEQLVEAKNRVSKKLVNNPEIYKLPESKRTVENLADYFVKQNEGTNRILPKEKRRYVIYLRKSTDDEAKQVRSLEDQKSECLELAHRLKVTVNEKDILQEVLQPKYLVIAQYLMQ